MGVGLAEKENIPKTGKTSRKEGMEGRGAKIFQRSKNSSLFQEFRIL